MKAAIVDESALRLIAGAGTGKTTTLFAKSAYLVERQGVSPNRLLAVTYSGKSRNDLQKRFKRHRSCAQVDISTIHALGYRIVGKARRKRPPLAPWLESEKDFALRAEGYVELAFRDAFVREHLLYFTLLYETQAPAPYGFDSIAQYHDWVRRMELVTLKGERLKSLQEVQIANFLHMNGITYKYEEPYQVDTATELRRSYKPDFYLPNYNIYIEHYGISRDGKTAPGIDARTYQRQMQWKRGIHQEHQTKCIETFSYEAAEGKLLENLRAALVKLDVDFRPADEDVLLDELRNVKGVSQLADLFRRVVPLWKERDDRSLTLADIYRGDAFLVAHAAPVLERLLSIYEADLRENDWIDFSDMIIEAQHMIERGVARCPYDAVLLDEAQDLSPARARLVAAYVKSGADVRLTAVGDDWQAIYRFAGSQPESFLRFDEVFGPDSVTLELSETHRVNDSIERPTSTFVARNPHQTQRRLKSASAIEPALHAIAHHFDETSVDVIAAEQLALTYSLHGKSIVFVYRTKFDKPGNLGTLEAKYPKTSFICTSAHGSKGLEADFVVVLGANATWNGFPSMRPTEPAVEPLLPKPDGFPLSEDRRLFYVAATRGREATVICYRSELKSPFVDELYEYASHATMTFIDNTDTSSSNVTCRSCGIGYYVVRGKDGRVFLGCSHYPACLETSAVCPTCGGIPYIDQESQFVCKDCGQKAGPVCPSCQRGWLVKKSGRSGPFLGCSGWRVDRMGCNFTRNVPDQRQQR